MIKRLYNSLIPYVYHPLSSIVFAALFFIEAIFFVPVDPILIMFCVKRQDRAYFYALLATISSVIGGIVAYTIGALLFNSLGLKIITTFSSMEIFNKISDIYRNYETIAVLFAGFTPFPYKIITLSAGFCKLPLIPFIIYSFIGRGTRFFLVAFLIKRYGKHIEHLIDRYFNYLFLTFTLLILLCMVILK